MIRFRRVRLLAQGIGLQPGLAYDSVQACAAVKSGLFRLGSGSPMKVETSAGPLPCFATGTRPHRGPSAWFLLEEGLAGFLVSFCLPSLRRRPPPF